MCQTYDKSKGGDTRELQSRMVPPKKNGSSHLKYKLTCLIQCKFVSGRLNTFMIFYSSLHIYYSLAKIAFNSLYQAITG